MGLGEIVSGFAAPSLPGPDRIEGRFSELHRLDAGLHAGPLFEAAVGADAIWDYMGYGPFADLVAYRALLARFEGQTDPFFYAICEAGGGPALGVASYLRIAPADGVIEIGNILLTPPLQRSVVASEALMLMVRWAFAAGYRRVEWKCNALNAASRRAALRLGFRFEGVFRQHMLVKGRNRDTAWFSIIDREWPALCEAYDTWLAAENFDTAGVQRQRLSALTDAVLPGRYDGVLPVA